MAGDWIKMRSNLWDDPRVAAIVDATNSSEAAVIGALYWLWAAADQHSTDGHLPGMSFRQVNRKTGVKGFAEALASVGWIEPTDDGVLIARFGEHNGKSAKRRAAESVRKMSARDADKLQTETGQPAHLEKEKEKEESKEGATKAAPVDFRTEVFRRWKALPDGGGGAYLAKLIRESGEGPALNAADRTLEAERADPKGFVQSLLRGAREADTAEADLWRGVK